MSVLFLILHPLLSQVFHTLGAMTSEGVDFLLDVHGDEELPVSGLRASTLCLHISCAHQASTKCWMLIFLECSENKSVHPLCNERPLMIRTLTHTHTHLFICPHATSTVLLCCWFERHPLILIALEKLARRLLLLIHDTQPGLPGV